MTSDSWETEITHDGLWPFRWCWCVTHWESNSHFKLRVGNAMTKERAQRAAIRAQLSMQRDDVTVTEDG